MAVPEQSAGPRRAVALRRALASAVLSALLLARAAAADPQSEAARYDSCLAQTRTAPSAAFEAALAWESEGGGAPARHCTALALIALGEYGEAAMRLGALAEEPGAGDAAMRAQILSQAGNAWLLEGQPERAVADFTRALTLAPNDADLLIDRARAYAMAQSWPAAEQDLSQALAQMPGRADAYLYRASARRMQEKIAAARADVEAALGLIPAADPALRASALLERGNLRRLTGDDAGARQDWLEVLRLAPEGPAAKPARDNLERLDLKPQG